MTKRFCVIKGTAKAISSGGGTDKHFENDALSAGIKKGEFEIINEQEYQKRKRLEPVPDPIIPEREQALIEKVKTLESYIEEHEAALVEMMEMFLGGDQ